MACPSGRLLSDDDVCDLLQACYRIGHQTGKESGFLRHCSRHAMREIAEHVALRLKENVAVGGRRCAIGDVERSVGEKSVGV